MSSCFLFSQNLLMQNGTFTQCTGTFTDSGGAASDYGLNEDLILTICPDVPGEKVMLEFTAFSTIGLLDFMQIFNGDDITAPTFGVFTGSTTAIPRFVRATEANVSGCLTITFVTGAAPETSSGWFANISCGKACQSITSQIDNATPIPNSDGYIRVCPNENITLEGSGVFSNNGIGATYEWDLGDGNTVAGQIATFSYPTPGVYLVNLNIRDSNTTVNPLGCKNNNFIGQVIQVGTAPDFNQTQAERTSICLGESVDLIGGVNPIEFALDCTNPVGELTPLPDGTGEKYETSITVDCYDEQTVVTNANQIISICINIEHSFAGDLDILIVSPNGKSTTLLSTNESDLTYLGAADGNDDGIPGVGAQYCFSNTATIPLRDAPQITAGTNDASDSYSPGNYLPEESFGNLIGSPLNGNWTLSITDNLALDDGTIFSWSIEFDNSLLPAELSFKPDIISEMWDVDPTIINTNGNTITVSHTVPDTYCYTYRVIDDFGCEYEKETCIDVFPDVNIVAVQDIETCTAFSNQTNIDLTINDANVLGAQDPTLFNITYHLSQADADAGINPIETPSNFLGTDGDLIIVRLKNKQTICFDTAVFELIINTIGFNLQDNFTLCVNTDGTEVISNPIIETGLNTIDYEFQWYLNREILVGEINNSYTPIQGGKYTVVVTDVLTGCSTSLDDVNATTEVNESSPPVLTASQVNLSFVDKNAILATAVFNGNLINSIIAFEFSLDGGPWVHNTPNDGTYIFENVGAGEHTVEARDINGCGMTSVKVNVLDYPLYFTPNGDGIHDTWNIIGIESQPNAKIIIFNRYGKLIKQISPTGRGWDGTYNGQLMPSNDYWFTVEYIEPITNEKNEFRAHFSLKR